MQLAVWLPWVAAALVLAGSVLCGLAWRRGGRYGGLWAVCAAWLGLLGLFRVRPALSADLARLRDAFEILGFGSERFRMAFDRFAAGTLLAAILMLAFFLGFLITHREKALRRGFTVWVLAAMVVLLGFAVWCGFRNVNKLLDVPGYMMRLAVCECMVLCLPLGIRRAQAIGPDGG